MSESDQRAVREVLLPVVGVGAEAEDLENKVDEMCSLLATWKLHKKEADEEEDEDLRLEEVQGSHQVRRGSCFSSSSSSNSNFKLRRLCLYLCLGKM